MALTEEEAKRVALVLAAAIKSEVRATLQFDVGGNVLVTYNGAPDPIIRIVVLGWEGGHDHTVYERYETLEAFNDAYGI